MERKFSGLSRYFDTLLKESVTLSFEFIEQLIGKPLCPSARKYAAYWQPSKTHTITRCWVSNGYKMTGVDLSLQQVSFQKEK